MMLHNRSYQATDVERVAVENLLEQLGRPAAVSVTRISPGETGPLQVEVDGELWLIDASGTTTKP